MRPTLTIEMKGAAADPPRQTAGPFAKTPEPTYADLGEHDGSAHALRLEALRRRFRQVGLALHELGCDELALTGPGAPGRTLADLRAASLYLRTLSGGVA